MATTWTALGTYTTAIPGAGTAPTLKALANSARVLGAEIDNTSGKDMFADWDLLCKFQSSPSAGGVVNLYLVPAVDGTNYADGSDSLVPASSLFAGSMPVQANMNAQRVALRNILLPPGKFKPLIENGAGQALTNVDNENVLSYRTYNVES